ncbi:MAG: DNA polymerase III delta prime subunit, partial [uncultured Thermomicrobiales bacterium]
GPDGALAHPGAGARDRRSARGDRQGGGRACLPLRRAGWERPGDAGPPLRPDAQLRDARGGGACPAGAVRRLPILPQDRARHTPGRADRRPGRPGGGRGGRGPEGRQAYQPEHRHDPRPGGGHEPPPDGGAVAGGDRRGCRDDARGGGQRLPEDARGAPPLHRADPGRAGPRGDLADDPVALPGG